MKNKILISSKEDRLKQKQFLGGQRIISVVKTKTKLRVKEELIISLGKRVNILFPNKLTSYLLKMNSVTRSELVFPLIIFYSSSKPVTLQLNLIHHICLNCLKLKENPTINKMFKIHTKGD